MISINNTGIIITMPYALFTNVGSLGASNNIRDLSANNIKVRANYFVTIFSYFKNSSVSLMLILFGPSIITLLIVCGTCN